MEVKALLDIIGSQFYVGVPDSQLKPLINFLMGVYGIDPKRHLIAANEGNCVALASGYHLSTGKVPVVYMQNSGEGNAISPIASLLSDKVYGIPVVFIIGWRGEPGVHDEPQHVYQGEVTLKLLDVMGIASFVIDKNTTVDDVKEIMSKYTELLNKGKSVAFVVKKGALSTDVNVDYKNNNKMVREEIIKHILKFSNHDPIVSTTGKTSRELFELRNSENTSHKYDFLTVGSMGHASSIALGIALNKQSKVWCIDGDGAVIMHLGAMAVIGATHPNNLIHIVINNGAHESVGGMPTVAKKIDLVKIAQGCGYANAVRVDNFESLDKELQSAKDSHELTFIEVLSKIGSRADLGRPTTSALENKENFMSYLKTIE